MILISFYRHIGIIFIPDGRDPVNSFQCLTILSSYREGNVLIAGLVIQLENTLTFVEGFRCGVNNNCNGQCFRTDYEI